jgi:superfamily II DNA or RNA helicase
VIKIKIDNASSQIQCSPELLFRIRKDCLSYMAEGAEFAMRVNPMWDGRIYLCNKAGIFPTGLLGRLIEWLKKNSTSYSLLETRAAPRASCSLKIAFPEGMEPRYYQTDAMNLTDTQNRGVFVMGTGAGKTLTSAMIIEKRKLPTLFITPDTGLREQAFRDYSKWFGPSKVDTKIENTSAPIIISNIQALTNKDPKFFARFNMLMVDEFHHAAAKTYKQINQTCLNAYYRYGFTGTFVRTDGADLEMYGVLSNIIFRKTTSELINEGFLVRPYITISTLDMSELNARGTGKRRLNMNYKDAYNYVIKYEPFHKKVAQIAEQKSKEGKQTLILVRRKEHGRVLRDLIGGSFYLSGDDKSSDREKVKRAFVEKRIKTLIATNIFGEGQDIPSIDVLINARAEKTEIQTSQGIGRALRKHKDKDKAEVYDFLFIGQKHLEDHSIERLNTYRREKAFKIQIRRS